MELPPIDFEEASRAWSANKIRKGASYVYKCENCARPATQVKGNSNEFLCGHHRRDKIKQDIAMARKAK